MADLHVQENHQVHINQLTQCKMCGRKTTAPFIDMIIQRLPYVIFRSYPDFGYLTDNRNFGYDTASHSCLKVGEILLSKVASIFYSLLSNAPQDIEIIVDKLGHLFPDVSRSSLRNDAIEFYTDLSSKGFVSVDENPRLCYFSYDNRNPFDLNIPQEQPNENVFSNTFGRTYQLSRVHIDISGLCNENCIHCYIPSNRKNGLMSITMFENILYQCKEMNVINLTLSGGEPMLNPNLIEFLLLCNKHNFSVNVLSNLTMLSDELLAVFSNNPLISVQTSLYAMDETIHDTITRKKGSFRKTMSAIDRLYEANIPMQINCPIMKQNLQYYKNVLLFAHSKNIEADSDYSLFGSFDFSKTNLDCRLSTEEVSKLLRNDKNGISELKDLNYNEKDSMTAICPVCKTSLCISNSGNIYPCEGWQSLVLGNINNNSLKSIWEESHQVKHLRNLTFGHFPKCNSCEAKSFCNPCLIMNANEDSAGDYEKINPFICEVTRLKKANNHSSS